MLRDSENPTRRERRFQISTHTTHNAPIQARRLKVSFSATPLVCLTRIKAKEARVATAETACCRLHDCGAICIRPGKCESGLATNE